MRYAKYIIFNPHSSEYPRSLVSSGGSQIADGLETAGHILAHNQVEEAVAGLTALREALGERRDIQVTALLAYLLGLCYKKWALLQDGEASWERAASSLEEALGLVHATHDVQTYAVVYNDLGFVYQSLASFKERKEFLSKAQSAFEKARFFLEQWEKNADPQEEPVDYWLGLYHLGNTYNALAQLTGVKEHYQTAISFYEEVVRNRPNDQFQSVIALAQYSLGFAHHALTDGASNEQTANFAGGSQNSEAGSEEAHAGARRREQAKIAYQEALRVFNSEDYPLEYSHIQNCLANLYLDFARTHSQEEYLNQAVIASKEVLQILTSKAPYPIGNALILHNLGSACKLYSKIRDNEKSYLWKSLYYFEAILKIKNLPPGAGVVGSAYLNLGLVYSRMAGFKNDIQNLNNAMGYFERALQFYTTAEDPVRMAITQTNMGDVCLALSKSSESVEWILKSLAAFRDAGKLFREQQRIADYAVNQAKLGAAYLELAARNSDQADILKALECYQAGLDLLDQKSNPEEYDRIQAQVDEARRRLDTVGKE